MAKNKRILLIEDDIFLRELAARKLRAADFKVAEASTGEEGLRKVKNEEFEAVILDIILPGMGGFEVLEKMRDGSGRKNFGGSVIIFSNLGEKEEIEKAKKLGADDYLVKAHITPAGIVRKVKDHI